MSEEKDEWVVLKGGYFYRPNAHGYTRYISEAGVWRYEEAKKFITEGVHIERRSAFIAEPEAQLTDQTETLRDKFAMSALTGLLAFPGLHNLTWEEFAEYAFASADAMMEARKNERY